MMTGTYIPATSFARIWFPQKPPSMHCTSLNKKRFDSYSLMIVHEFDLISGMRIQRNNFAVQKIAMLQFAEKVQMKLQWTPQINVINLGHNCISRALLFHLSHDLHHIEAQQNTVKSQTMLGSYICDLRASTMLSTHLCFHTWDSNDWVNEHHVVSTTIV